MAVRKDNITELFGIDQMRKQQTEAINIVNAFVTHVESQGKKVQDLNMGLGTKQSLGTIRQMAKEVEGITKEQAQIITELAKAHSVLALARQRDASAAKTQTQENIALAKETDRLAKAEEKKVANLNKANNAYEIAKKRYRDLANAAKRYQFELGENNKKTQQAIRLANDYHARLTKAENAVGQFNRQVGNYNIVGAQFNQILREVPNAGLGMRTFLIAISNNASYFAESISDARKQGASFKDILGILKGQLIGVTGVVNLAVLGITYFAANMGKAKDETEDTVDALKKLSDELDKIIRKRQLALNTKDEGISSILGIGITKESEKDIERAIELMKAQGASEEEINNKQKELHKERIARFSAELNMYEPLQSAISAYSKELKEFGAVSLETEKNLEEQLIAAGVAQEDVVKLRIKIGELGYTRLEEISVLYSEKIIDLEENIKDEKNRIEVEKYTFERDQHEKSIKEREQAEKEYLKRLREQRKKEQSLGGITPLSTTSQNEAGNIRSQSIQQLSIVDDIERQRLLRLEQAYAEGLIDYEEYQLEKQQITIQYENDRLNIELDAAQRLLNNSAVIGDERIALEKRIQDLKLELAINANKEKLENDKRTNEELTKNTKAEAAKQEAIRRKVVAVIRETANLIFSINSARTERTLNNLDREENAIDRQEERDRERATRTIADKKEREEKIAIIEAQADEKRRKLEVERRDREREQARREKELALFNILLNMYQAVGKEIGTKGVAGIVTGSTALAFASTIIAAVSTLAVPAYAEGTDDHIGGLALVGEGMKNGSYVKEMILEPNSNPYIVDKPTLMDLPRHSKVIPMDDMHQMKANTIMLQGGGDMKKTEDLLRNIYTELKKDKKGSSVFDKSVWERKNFRS